MLDRSAIEAPTMCYLWAAFVFLNNISWRRLIFEATWVGRWLIGAGSRRRSTTNSANIIIIIIIIIILYKMSFVGLFDRKYRRLV